jgi:hypothetical protein
MARHTQLALVLCVAVAGTAVEARADCHHVRGSIAETRIPSNDQFGRLLGTVTGVLNGASTVFITGSRVHGRERRRGRLRRSAQRLRRRRPSTLLKVALSLSKGETRAGCEGQVAGLYGSEPDRAVIGWRARLPRLPT